MVAEINYAPRSDEKRELWSMKIDPKLKWLAQIAAHDENMSLSALVEKAIRLLLVSKTKLDYEEGIDLSQPAPLWMEGLYSPDEATRMFMLAACPSYMNKEQRFTVDLLFNKLAEKGGAITLPRFRDLWEEFVGGIRRDAGIDE